MISLYPLLVSNTVSKSIIPGVCKALENYIMVYGLSGLLARAREFRGDYRIRLNKVVKMENIEEDIEKILYQDILSEQGSAIYGATGPGSKNQSDEDYEERIARARERGKISARPKEGSDASVRLEPYNYQTISLEPTWMKIDQVDKNGNTTSGVIGVKVVPYAVKSDVSLSKLLMYDKQVNTLQRLAILTGRRMTNTLYKLWMKLWLTLPFTSKKEYVSGDPRKDILLKRNMISAGSAQDIFVLANQAELSEDFYASAKGMWKLEKMGWGSIIIADDVNRRVAFCMQELKGICSMIPYTMLYQTFSQAKVYEDIEDAKRSGSSIFKVKREKMSKLIGEDIAQNKIEEFTQENLPLLENKFIAEAEYIDENIGNFIKKLKPSNFKLMLPNILQGKINNIPMVSPEKVVKLAMKLNPDFKKGYILAKRVISNSAGEVSEDIVDWTAIMLSIRASVKKTDFMNEIKEGLKKFIKMFRRSKLKAKPDKITIPKEHILDATFGWVTIIGGLTLVAAAYKYTFVKLATLISLIYKEGSAKLAGIDPQTIQQSAEDWTEVVVESGKEHLTHYAPWIGLALLVAIMLRKLLSNK